MSTNEEYLDQLLKSVQQNTTEQPLDVSKEELEDIMSTEEVEAIFAQLSESETGMEPKEPEFEVESDMEPKEFEVESEPEMELEEFKVESELETEPFEIEAEPEMEPEEFEIKAELQMEPEEFEIEAELQMEPEEFEIEAEPEIQPEKMEADWQEVTDEEPNAQEDPLTDLDFLNEIQGMSEEESENLLDIMNEQGITEAQEVEASLGDPLAEPEIDDSDILSLLDSIVSDDFGEEAIEIEEAIENVSSEAVPESSMEEPAQEDLVDIFSTDIPEMEAEAVQQETVPEEKKPGILKRLWSFLFSENEEDEEEESSEVQELSSVTEENAAIMKELDKESNKKKGKKDKKKGKKGKKEEENEEENEEGTEETENPKKQKKQKKVKQPKEQKVKEEPKTAEKGLSKKKVMMVAILCLSLLVVILLCTWYLSDGIEMKMARDAYYQGDYKTCYETMYGKKLNDSDAIMFQTSEMALKIERKTKAYENYIAMGKKAQALDALLQWVNQYEELLNKAESIGMAERVMEKNTSIMTLLSEEYGLTESEITQILASKDDVTYSLYLQDIVNGKEFSVQEESSVQPEEVLENVLPAEEELTDNEFVE